MQPLIPSCPVTPSPYTCSHSYPAALLHQVPTHAATHTQLPCYTKSLHMQPLIPSCPVTPSPDTCSHSYPAALLHQVPTHAATHTQLPCYTKSLHMQPLIPMELPCYTKSLHMQPLIPMELPCYTKSLHMQPVIICPVSYSKSLYTCSHTSSPVTPLPLSSHQASPSRCQVHLITTLCPNFLGKIKIIV